MECGKAGKRLPWVLWDGTAIRIVNSEKKVSEAAGIGQATVNRILNCEGSTSIGVLSAIARAFGRDAYELILPPGNAGLIDYDHHEYAGLPQEEKNKITAFIKFIVSQNQ